LPIWKKKIIFGGARYNSNKSKKNHNATLYFIAQSSRSTGAGTYQQY
jgi:hypothetical protein